MTVVSPACLGALIVLTVPNLLTGNEVKDGYPSQEIDPARKNIKALSGILMPWGDLRNLFADGLQIDDRIARKVCIVDGLLKEGPVEVTLVEGDTVRTVLDKVQTSGWRNTGRQIKLIKKYELIQSPRSTLAPETKQDTEQFLKREVSPGDFIFLSITI